MGTVFDNSEGVEFYISHDYLMLYHSYSPEFWTQHQLLTRQQESHRLEDSAAFITLLGKYGVVIPTPWQLLDFTKDMLDPTRYDLWLTLGRVNLEKFPDIKVDSAKAETIHLLHDFIPKCGYVFYTNNLQDPLLHMFGPDPLGVLDPSPSSDTLNLSNI